MKKIFATLISSALAVVGSASANLITIADGLGTVECTTICEAFTLGAPALGDEPNAAGTLSNSAAWYYDGTPSNEAAEASRLSILIDGVAGRFGSADATKTTGNSGSMMFSTLAEYVVLKVGNVGVYIKNLSGGSLTVDYTSFPGAGSGLSHYTEFGRVADVPIPGAIWLMIAGISGLGFSARKKKSA